MTLSPQSKKTWKTMQQWYVEWDLNHQVGQLMVEEVFLSISDLEICSLLGKHKKGAEGK